MVLKPALISDNYQEYMYSFFISLYDAIGLELMKNAPYW